METPLANVFGIPDIPASITIDVRDSKHEMIPRINPNYVFRKDILSDMLAWIRGAAGDDPLYLVGPTGTGKSSVVEQVAARLKIPLYVVSCHEHMEIPEFFGRFVIRNGNMEWADGPYLQGLKDAEGAWVLLDEVDTLEPGTFIGLNALNEGRRMTIPETGEVVDPLKNGAKIICAGNTAGNGDSTGLYQSTKRHNLASMGRFMMVEIGYPEPAEESLVLEKAVPEVPSAIREKMVEVAGKVRELFTNQQIEVTFCTRTLIRWCRLSKFYKTKPNIDVMTYSLDRAIGFRAEAESRSAMHEIVQRILA